jgi:hypothetical protein
MSKVIVNKKMLSMLKTVTIECYDIGVLQFGSRANDIQELFLFSVRQTHHVYDLHREILQQNKKKCRINLKPKQDTKNQCLKNRLRLYFAIRKYSFVNRTKRSLSQKVAFIKEVSSQLKLRYGINFRPSSGSASFGKTSS